MKSLLSWLLKPSEYQDLPKVGERNADYFILIVMINYILITYIFL